MDRRRVALAVVVVAVLALAGCSRPPPEAEVVCDGCVGGIEETAEETNRSITVEDSVTHVYLRDSGDARVEARMTLSGADADDLRVNDSLLATVRERIEAGGTETIGALAITFVWGVGVVFVGIVLFYVVLWVVTQVTDQPTPTPGRYGRL
ncbi:hypothetical protein BRD11_02760 [Halobacteriales archaeon SW_12_69_24]|nr:MAG: hypothetical protein BRD11_02760 [Halobacteriales archaeon SW_12_69_24]